MKEKLSEKDKHPILYIDIDKVPDKKKAIIDTGCTENYFFIGKNKPEDYDIFNYTGKSGVAYAPGEHQMEHKIVLHKIKIGEWEFELEFGLCPGSFYGCTAILGTRFLYDNKISLYIKNDYFILNKEA